MRAITVLMLALLVLAGSAYAQDTAPPPTPAATALPSSETDALLTDLRALVDEARLHAEDSRRYAEDASGFLGIFEALGLSVTVGGAVLAAFGVLRLLSAQNELTETRQRFEKELKQREAELDELNERLRTQAETQQRMSAEATARATLALSLLPLGERQYRAQDFPGAIKTYERALELDERNPVTHLRLGYVYTQSGMLEKSRYHLMRALEIEPEFPYALAALGYVFRRIGEKMPESLEREHMLNQGEGKLLEALRISPMLVDDDGESWWGSLGGLYRRRGQIEQAVYAYERAAEVTPHSSYPFSNLALLYMQAGQQDRMMATYKRVERLAAGETQAEVDNYWAYADLLTAQLAQGKTADATNSLQSVLDLAPEGSPYMLTMLVDTLKRLTTALGTEVSAAQIAPFIGKVQAEIDARQRKQRATGELAATEG